MIDLQKRNRVIAKHADMEEGVTLSLEEFFDGNADSESIATNLSQRHPGIGRFREVLFALRSESGVTDVRIEVHEWPNPDQPLDDDIWIAADRVFVISRLAVEQVRERAASLLPDEVFVLPAAETPADLPPVRSPESVIALWWD